MPSRTQEAAIVRALLGYGAKLVKLRQGTRPEFTPDRRANDVVFDDPFAFLLAVIFDQGITAERAWAAPWLLKTRLGHLDPERIARTPVEVRRAIKQSPALHRFTENLSRWVVEAGDRVVRIYGGDAGRIWVGKPRVEDVHARFEGFKGIGQKKAAMAVEILARDIGVPFENLAGTEPAFDVHIRRVFLRTGLASADSLDAIRNAARTHHPQRPGEIDYPAWEIGRTWCRPKSPTCAACVLEAVCPKLVSRGDHIRGI